MAKSRAQTKSPQSAPQQQAPPAPQAGEPNHPARYVCIHGHFYQPPRENPWLETVEIQDSAAPYHDWNERITSECYAPNGASRILDDEKLIVRILNNYSRMSFNFGPTLLSWLADFAPRTYRMIIDADRYSAELYSGHGSAIAQVYNHVIMPLANERDALTQIRWGIADFEHRFNRKPEGMWLAETACNRHVLDLLAREGIRFTILAPNQCARVRPVPPPAPAATEAPPSSTTAAPAPPVGEIAHDGSQPRWYETPNASVDPRRPYLVELDEGRSIAVFFYDGPNSRAIAFEGLLESGENFANRLTSVFSDDTARAQLSHVATDGESYGHHHAHGEMALSYAMRSIAEHHSATLTNYGEFLEKFPPDWQAEVADDTSWSCAHGVERWRSNCGCNSGGHPGWNQEWRAPLRRALDYLRDAVDPLCEQLAPSFFKDLWATREAYIAVILDRSPSIMDAFFEAHQTHPLSPAERVTALELLELQRHTQLMYTSCGWFFDEVSGIETVQVIAYAGRVLQLGAHLFGEPGKALETKFLEDLAQARSNIPELGDAAEVYRRWVTGMEIGLEQVGAHYAISSMFRPYPEDGEIFCFDVHRDSHEVYSSGRGRVAVGRGRVSSRVTLETENIAFAVIHLGDQNLSAAVRRFNPAVKEELDAFDTFNHDVVAAIRRANLPEVIRLFDRFFGDHSDAHDSESTHVHPQTAYSLTSLFADEQHRIVQIILNQTLSEMEDSLRRIYEDHDSLLDFLTETGMTPPPALAVAADFALNSSLRRAIEADVFDPDRIHTLIDRAHRNQIELNPTQLSYSSGQRMKRAMIALESAAAGENPVANALDNAVAIASTLRTMPFEVNFWQAQNIWNDLLRRSDTTYWTPEWKEGFKKLGETLGINVDQLVVEQGVPAF